MEILSDFQRTSRAAKSIVRNGMSVQTKTLEAGSFFFKQVARGTILPTLAPQQMGRYPSGYLSAI